MTQDANGTAKRKGMPLTASFADDGSSEGIPTVDQDATDSGSFQLSDMQFSFEDDSAAQLGFDELTQRRRMANSNQ